MGELHGWPPGVLRLLPSEMRRGPPTDSLATILPGRPDGNHGHWQRLAGV